MPEADKAIPSWVWLSVLAVIIADLASKYAILHTLQVGEVKPILPFFALTLAFNPGAAFSFLAASGGWQRYFFAAVAVVVSFWLVQELRRPMSLVQRWGTLLILGGAIGNLYDRIVHGHVVDFILVYWQKWSYPVFNLADSAICIGVALLLFGWLKQSQLASQNRDAPAINTHKH